jgi:hypothetical protein
MKIDFNDAVSVGAFLTPQMLRINTEIDKQVYPSFDYSRLLFVDTDGGMWARGSVFYSGDIAGKAEWFAGSGFDMPYADVTTTQFLQENHLKAIGYEWNRQELEQAATIGRDLGADKAEAARTVAESNIYSMVIRGDATKTGAANVTTGLINNASVPTATVPADGTGSATTFASKTPAQVLRDVNAVLNAPFIASGETLRANTLLLPTSRRMYLSQNTLGTASDKTLLSFIKEENDYTQETGQPLTIIGTRELETAGASSSARMMAYDNSRNVVRAYLPGPHTFFEPFRKGSFTWEVPGLFNYGGVEFRRPKGAAYRDGI